MKHKTLFAALALTLAAGVAATTVAAAEPAAKPERGTRATLDANGDGAIDRAEAAASPKLAQRFDTLDRNGDGRLDAGERPRHQARGHGRRHGGQRLHGGPGGIERLDADGDGRISRAEVEAAPAGRGARPNRWLQHFDAIDANRDGQVVRTEFNAWQDRQRSEREAAMRKRFDERFAAADLNRDGKLSRVEADEKMPHLAQRFAWMDDNRDGFLSRAELQPRKR